MACFERAVEIVLNAEKGLVNDKNDKGGITNFGISYRFLRNVDPDTLKRCGIYGEVDENTIRDLTPDQAKNLYYHCFWTVTKFAAIAHQEHANYVFLMAVNMNIAPAIKCLQRAVWAVMKRRTLEDDGILGEKTLAAMKLCGFLLLPALRSECAGYYRCIPDNDYFLEGWLNRAYQN